jgi:thiosulfate reductase cytochrome b subunit
MTDADESGPQQAALARNWLTVLLVDAALGLVGVLAGIAAVVWWHVVIGAVLIAAGLGYLIAVVRRGIEWRSQRRAAGLS